MIMLKKYLFNVSLVVWIILAVSVIGANADQGLFVERAEKETKLYGYTRSARSITLSSEVPGKIVKINYNVGDDIGKAPIIEIDPTFINFKIEQAKQSLKKLDINMDRLRANIKYLQKGFNRIDDLHKSDSIAEVKRDEAEQALMQAKMELESLTQDRAMLIVSMKELQEQKKRHNLTIPNKTYYVTRDAHVRFGPSTNDKKLGKLFSGAQIKVYEEENGWTRIGKDKWIDSSLIRSRPTRGLIMTVKVAEVGEIIGQGIPLARISDFRELAVPLSVTAPELQAIKALPDPFPGKLEGKDVKVSVNYINPEFDEVSRKMNLELVLRNYQGERRGGLKLEIPIQTKTEGLLVPKAAVVNRYENPRVTLKDTEESVSIIIIGETETSYIIAENNRLFPGMELLPENGPTE